MNGTNPGLVFVGGCLGYKSDISIGAEVNLGFFRHLNDIPGKSEMVGLGFSIPPTDIGAGASLVFNTDDELNINELIGCVMSFGIPGLSYGLSPIDLSYAACDTPITKKFGGRQELIQEKI